MRNNGRKSAIVAWRNATNDLMMNGSIEIPKVTRRMRKKMMTDPDDTWDEAKAIAAADDADEAYARELELQYEYPKEVDNDD
jgi:hypothetical protein